MGNKLAGASIYEDFEPSYQWHTEQGHDVLHMYLQGFEREQIHVKPQKGSLVIWGERPMEPPKRQRFRKEISLPRNFKEEEIHAQFSATGILSVTVPKKETLGRQMSSLFTSVIFNKRGLLIMVLNLLMVLIAIGVYVIRKYKPQQVADKQTPPSL